MANLNISSKYTMNSGYEIPALGYGVYKTPAAEAEEVTDHAIGVGYRHVDSAVAYRNEGPTAIGMLKSKVPREQLFFTSKVPPKDLSYKTTKACIDETLVETGLSYVDLYLIHSPYGGKEARLGAWRALVEAVEAGKVRSIGVSNYGVHHLEELDEYIRQTEAAEGKGKGGVLSVNQVELHPWLARPDIVEWCKKRGVIMEAYSPVVRMEREKEPVLIQLAKKHGKTPAQILLRWSLQMGFVPLPKSVTKSRIEENIKLYDFQLSAEDMESLDTGEYSPCAWDPTVSKD
ncbi:aldo-keto reductase-like protein [Eremomyces bilateralis CBS 781.70]|uniref:Aldo-keto reductase-like protein n=1 Tax=Eremomyces bilateralis CBS 781.70 TaxID=1392243 RepID=A0A6G1FUJ6_9PEZI|nr:aldo-keto reductase-like protein [Eremomyces bilateralis CBS 781.70]KAF1809339.1 aldo-keto reductase-like protein [Eremomyces bilateralis CBS 781.70]